MNRSFYKYIRIEYDIIYFALDTIGKSGDKIYISTVSNREFSVAHFTGKVTYDITEMPHKNRDFLQPEMIDTLRMSSNNHIRELFIGKLTKTGNLILTMDHVKEVSVKSKWSSALIAEHEKNNKVVKLFSIIYISVPKSMQKYISCIIISTNLKNMIF